MCAHHPSFTSKGGLHGWAWIVRIIFICSDIEYSPMNSFCLKGCVSLLLNCVSDYMNIVFLSVTVICAMLAMWTMSDVNFFLSTLISQSKEG